MKKSEKLKKMFGYKDGGFTRPEGWEKSIKRSHFDSSKTFDGESYEDIAEAEKKKKGKVRQADFLKSISDVFKTKD